MFYINYIYSTISTRFKYSPPIPISMSLLEEQIKELLQRKPELYAVPHYPQQKIGYCQELNPKDNYNLSLAIVRIIPWGRFLERAYYIKNGQLSADFIKECTLVPVYLDKLVFDCDPTTYLDLRGKEKRPRTKTPAFYHGTGSC